jgi:hypothetical protein
LAKEKKGERIMGKTNEEATALAELEEELAGSLGMEILGDAIPVMRALEAEGVDLSNGRLAIDSGASDDTVGELLDVLAEGGIISQTNEMYPLAVGDAILACEARYGEEAAQHLERLKMEPEYKTHRAWVATHLKDRTLVNHVRYSDLVAVCVADDKWTAEHQHDVLLRVVSHKRAAGVPMKREIVKSLVDEMKTAVGIVAKSGRKKSAVSEWAGEEPFSIKVRPTAEETIEQFLERVLGPAPEGKKSLKPLLKYYGEIGEALLLYVDSGYAQEKEQEAEATAKAEAKAKDAKKKEREKNAKDRERKNRAAITGEIKRINKQGLEANIIPALAFLNNISEEFANDFDIVKDTPVKELGKVIKALKAIRPVKEPKPPKVSAQERSQRKQIKKEAERVIKAGLTESKGVVDMLADADGLFGGLPITLENLSEMCPSEHKTLTAVLRNLRGVKPVKERKAKAKKEAKPKGEAKTTPSRKVQAQGDEVLPFDKPKNKAKSRTKTASAEAG